MPASGFDVAVETPMAWGALVGGATFVEVLRLALLNLVVLAIGVCCIVFTVAHDPGVAVCAGLIMLTVFVLSLPAFTAEWWMRRLARDPDLSGWATLPLYWRDWSGVRRSPLTAQQAALFFTFGIQRPWQTRVPVLEALLDAGVDPGQIKRDSAIMWRGWIHVLRLVRYGLTVAEIEFLCLRTQLDPNALILLINDVCDPRRDLPELTAPDLISFCHGALPDAQFVEHVDRRREMLVEQFVYEYEEYGWRAPWFARLDLPPDDRDDAIARGVSIDQLRLMAAFASDQSAR